MLFIDKEDGEPKWEAIKVIKGSFCITILPVPYADRCLKNMPRSPLFGPNNVGMDPQFPRFIPLGVLQLCTGYLAHISLCMSITDAKGLSLIYWVEGSRLGSRGRQEDSKGSMWVSYMCAISLERCDLSHYGCVKIIKHGGLVTQVWAREYTSGWGEVAHLYCNKVSVSLLSCTPDSCRLPL